MTRIIVAYSGEPLPVAPPWRAEADASEFVTVTIDLGQAEDLESVRERALAAGAVRAHVLDARAVFARDYVLPALLADAAAGSPTDPAPLTVALSRPLIGKLLVEMAEMEQATGIAHAGSARLTTAIQSSGRELSIWRLAGSRTELDANMWGRAFDRGAPDASNLRSAPPESFYRLTRSIGACPDEPAVVDIRFDRGVPTAINDVVMPLVDLVASLTFIGGAHGIGRFETIDVRPDGTSAALTSEAPAGVLLHAAHRALRRSLPGRQAAAGAEIARAYSDLVARGLWVTPSRSALDAAAQADNQDVTGTIRLNLFKGRYQVHDNALVRSV